MAFKYRYFKNFNCFKISNTFDLMKPCFFVYRCYGLFPYTKYKNSLTFSKLGLLYSTILIIISSIYLIIVLYQCNVEVGIEFDTLEGLLQFNCYFILASFIWLYTYISNKNRLKLIKNILEISSNLSEKKLYRLATIIYIKDAVGFIFLMGQTSSIYWQGSLQLLIQKIFGLHITIIVFLMDFQYSNYILILKSCFKNINLNLLRLHEYYNNKEIDIPKNNRYKLQIHNIRLINLHDLQQKYLTVSLVIKELNSVFSLQIIATILMTVAEVTFGLYFFVLHSQGRKGIDLNKQIYHSYFIESITYYSLKMAIMVWICQTAKNESMKTGIIVHDGILNSNNEQLKIELNFFSLQLMQCENHFTTKCVVMEAKLITSVISGIVTHILILIQFLKTKEKSQKTKESLEL